ncbi:MFS transporter [Thermoactinomyces mirandus]|uniref:MFS transporter n=1 Tax=Thermoactinomyces mirandus TaxID=2756294 RepID=A0A7W1XS46_9BACL|nr:MFS transporter [Thermoactinomyces mirandus]MBA4602130.1 hypothetical protein [Thermoactinomyces mirandus]
MNIESRIKYYMCYRFFTGFLFFMPVLLSIYLKREISLEDIFLIECFYYLSIFLFEVPTGWLADRFGHDKSVFIGLVGLFITYSIFSVTYSLVGIIACQVGLGIFTTLISGSDRASFFNLIFEGDTEKSFLLQKRAHILFIAANLLSFVIGGLLYIIDSEGFWILLLTGVFHLLAGIFYFLYSKGLNGSKEAGSQDTRTNSPTRREIKKILLPCTFAGIVLGFLANFYWITQMYYDHLHITEDWRGVLFAVASLTTILFSRVRIFKNHSVSRLLVVLFPACYFIAVTENRWILPIYIIIYSLLKIEAQPFVENYILSIASDKKAFALSIASWIYNFVDVLLMILFYALFKYFQYSAVMIILGALVTLIILLAYLVYKIKRSVFRFDRS